MVHLAWTGWFTHFLYSSLCPADHFIFWEVDVFPWLAVLPGHVKEERVSVARLYRMSEWQTASIKITLQREKESSSAQVLTNQTACRVVLGGEKQCNISVNIQYKYTSSFIIQVIMTLMPVCCTHVDCCCGCVLCTWAAALWRLLQRASRLPLPQPQQVTRCSVVPLQHITVTYCHLDHPKNRLNSTGLSFSSLPPWVVFNPCQQCSSNIHCPKYLISWYHAIASLWNRLQKLNW